MLLSEVIARLQAVLTQNGDLDVTATADDSLYGHETTDAVRMITNVDIDCHSITICFWHDEEAAWGAEDEEEEEAPEYSLGICQKCNQWNDRLLAVDAEAPPTPECPMGYGSEMWLCPDCLQKWEERHAED